MLTRRLVCGLLLPVLLVVASFEMPMASLRIAWRFMVLSFDNPVTQALDDLVCETSPPSQADGVQGVIQLTHRNFRFDPDPVNFLWRIRVFPEHAIAHDILQRFRIDACA